MKINKDSILIGSDFEMFLMDKQGNIVSAIPFIRAGKKDPEKTSKDGCCIQHDGVLAECNVPPVKLGQYKEFWDNIEYVKRYIYDKFAREKDMELVCCPSAELDNNQFEDPEARESGCSQSYLAWLEGEIKDQCSIAETNVRSCGGHIHFSAEGLNDPKICMDLMKCFDVFLTIPSLFMDDDDRRRSLYGCAGEMRLCEWRNSSGFEARTLSNFWVGSEEYVEWVFNQIEKMIDYYNEHGMDEINYMASDVMDAINTPNREKAGEICEKFGNLILISESSWI